MSLYVIRTYRPGEGVCYVADGQWHHDMVASSRRAITFGRGKEGADVLTFSSIADAEKYIRTSGVLLVSGGHPLEVVRF